MEVFSKSFKNGDVIPTIYTCDGENISPHIAWKNFPLETKSFVLIMDNRDKSSNIFTHWIVYDIPLSVCELPENFPKHPEVNGIKQGINDRGEIGYFGPCPPRGDEYHRYTFTVYALKISNLGLPAGVPRSKVEKAIEGFVIAKAQIVGLYKRH
ncbi:MAG: YbhB/YbcL family Raf kinase inhibitor-like protein [Aquifex sp.]|nr:MAG: YbhB/YbcL family Raf kinase inhibitor-like protein [Aquifex sp.]